MKRILFCFLVVFCLQGCHSKEKAIELIPVSERLQAPEIRAQFLNAPAGLKLAKLRNKVVVVDFWATWCGPCVMELPDLVKLYGRYKTRGVEFIGLSVEANEGKPKKYFTKFLTEYGIQYPTGLVTTDTRSDYAVDPIPTTFFIDKSGRIALSFVGARDEEDFIGVIEKLLLE